MHLLANKEMVLKNGVKNIKKNPAYNGTCTVAQKIYNYRKQFNDLSPEDVLPKHSFVTGSMRRQKRICLRNAVQVYRCLR